MACDPDTPGFSPWNARATAGIGSHGVMAQLKFSLYIILLDSPSPSHNNY